MSDFLQWYNLIFYIPMAIGLLAAIGLGISGMDHDVSGDLDEDLDEDLDGDSDGDSDGDPDGPENWILSFLGIGRVPLAITFMALFLIFAGVGISMNTLLSSLILHWSGFALASVAVAATASFFGTAFLSRILSRVMPTTETDSVKKIDLIGCSGVATLPCDLTGGLAQIKNIKGDLYQIQCKSEKPIPKGSRIMTLEYEETSDTFTVIVDPTFSG